MAKNRKPVQHRVGNSNLLTEISILEEQWNMTRRGATRFLRQLRIPIMYIGNEGFFNFHVLEKVIFYLTRFGGTGFAAPGSVYKVKDKYKDKTLGNIAITITDDDVERMEAPLFIAEFMATGPRNNKPAAVTTLLKQLKG